MSNGVIIVLDCSSTSSNYIYDIRKEGFTPILMEFQVPNYEKDRVRQLHDFYYSLNGDLIPKIIKVGHNYEETLRIVKEINPILVLAGSDRAIDWATRLAFELDLPSNNPLNLPKMQNKYLMQKAIASAGLRSIKSSLVHSFQEAKAFYDRMTEKRIVVKPIHGKATIGVCICQNEKELKDAVAYNLSLIGVNTQKIDSAFLVQEYIDGTEYVINTTSCEKRHSVTSAMKYDKLLIQGRGKIYNYVKSVSPSCSELANVVDYTLKALDAIGLCVGPAHTEIMVDESGPVLIEVNCRPCGGLMRRTWLEKFLGHHETNIYLDSFLHPERFVSSRVFEPVSNGFIKPIIVPYDIYAVNNCLNNICSKLKSFDYELDMGGGRIYNKTIDFSTNGGFVFLCHDDLNVVLQDCLYLHKIETESPELIFESKHDYTTY